MIDFYHHLPEYINPIAFSVGGLTVRWYSIMYLAGFLLVYWLLIGRVRRREGKFSGETVADFILYSALGAIIGGRLGYILLYNLSYFWNYPLAILSPFNSNGKLVGIYGMSYFGGLVGIILVAYLFSKARKINFLELGDFIVPAIPSGYFLGRIGNFLNGELYGRATNVSWGMYFSRGGYQLRHPSQIYEALLEGLVLFLVLWPLRNKRWSVGTKTAIYLGGYGIFRFVAEFFRELDYDTNFVWGVFTIGQIFSLIIMASSVILWMWIKRKRVI